LIGDNCKDTYVYGVVSRLSPEAPVPVFQPNNEIVLEGMAGNVARNLEALNCQVKFHHTETSEKKRLIDERSKQHLIRIDNDAKCSPILGSFIDTSELNSYDAVVISDYNKGTVPATLIEWIRNEFKGPIFIDTKKTDLARFNGCFIKINQLEKNLAKTLPDDQWLIVTKGEKGAEYLGNTIAPDLSDDVIDVCGAGDTFLASLVYRYLDTKDVRKSIVFANKAAGITVQHVGVYAPSIEELVP
jgi:D-beta-D-heptose 7-phosphate kinase/D-beta-D-heptose 1-phosphate adenosyltransferase